MADGAVKKTSWLQQQSADEERKLREDPYFKLGAAEQELKMARQLLEQYRTHLEQKTKAIRGALEALEAHDTEHDSINGKNPDPHIVCAWDSLEAVSS